MAVSLAEVSVWQTAIVWHQYRKRHQSEGQIAAIDGPGNGIIGGFGIGAFVVVPWLAMNYAFAGRPMNLTVIDGVNVIAGCTIMGLVLTLF